MPQSAQHKAKISKGVKAYHACARSKGCGKKKPTPKKTTKKPVKKPPKKTPKGGGGSKPVRTRRTKKEMEEARAMGREDTDAPRYMEYEAWKRSRMNPMEKRDRDDIRRGIVYKLYPNRSFDSLTTKQKARVMERTNREIEKELKGYYNDYLFDNPRRLLPTFETFYKTAEGKKWADKRIKYLKGEPMITGNDAKALAGWWNESRRRENMRNRSLTEFKAAADRHLEGIYGYGEFTSKEKYYKNFMKAFRR